VEKGVTVGGDEPKIPAQRWRRFCSTSGKRLQVWLRGGGREWVVQEATLFLGRSCVMMKNRWLI
jgi:hypothetical protein